ncbi:hypothetical protein IIZ77_01395 [Candidatus Saccharibacteria bacterium]|nr:hypothetical protein [Candidatus Saccharibacteria bacterium]
MSKKLIAGAGVVASLAVALAPLATFATGESDIHNDEIVINVLPSCTFGDSTQSGNTLSGGITHGSGDAATWRTGDSNDPNVPNTFPSNYTPKTDTESTGAGTVVADLREGESAINESHHTAYYTRVKNREKSQSS